MDSVSLSPTAISVSETSVTTVVSAAGSVAGADVSMTSDPASSASFLPLKLKLAEPPAAITELFSAFFTLKLPLLFSSSLPFQRLSIDALPSKLSYQALISVSERFSITISA